MIRHLIVFYLGVVLMLFTGPEPLWAVPLLLVSISYITENRWIGLLGILTFMTVSLGHLPEPHLDDPAGLALLAVCLILPGVLALDLVLAERPYRPIWVGPRPLVAVLLLSAGFIGSLLFLTRVQRIGIYLDSDPLLQVFMVTSLSILFAGPVLLSGWVPGKGQ